MLPFSACLVPWRNTYSVLFFKIISFLFLRRHDPPASLPLSLFSVSAPCFGGSQGGARAYQNINTRTSLILSVGTRVDTASATLFESRERGESVRLLHTVLRTIVRKTCSRPANVPTCSQLPHFPLATLAETAAKSGGARRLLSVESDVVYVHVVRTVVSSPLAIYYYDSYLII